MEGTVFRNFSLSLALAITFSIGSFGWTMAAFALPIGENLDALVPPASLTANYNFEGIVALDNCSGSIARFEHSGDTDPAMVLSNGHCLESGFPTPGTYVYQQPSSRTFKIIDPNGQALGTLHAIKVIFGTMTKTDVSLYQLQETYAEILEKFNVRPLTLSSQRPSTNDPLEVISGYWRRGYTCSLDGFVPQLKEDVFTFTDSIRYSSSGCEVIGGTSGSPIVFKGSRTVIGVNNTSNRNGESCTMNNPCEVDENGNVRVRQGNGYGQQTFWFYTCLNRDKQLDLSVQGCLLKPN
jgi:V8-like Glu-specific endopeptidase